MAIFPEINHINDILPFIADRPEFKVTDKGWYSAINYMVAYDDSFDCPVRAECRGLIFDKSGKLISRPYHKFFNVGEKSYTSVDSLDLSMPHVVLDKLDGSMIRPIPCDTGFRLGTKAGVTDVAMNAEVFIADKPNYSEFIEYLLMIGATPIFEWVSRKNRIVVDYDKDDLILTAIRYNTTGRYVNYETTYDLATRYNIPIVRAWGKSYCREGNVAGFVESIREWSDDAEGIIIRFDDGRMLKVKTADYVLRHKCKESIRLEKNVLSVILNDSLDDLLPLLDSSPSDRDRIVEFANDFNLAIFNFCDTVSNLFEEGYAKYPESRDFAVKYVKNVDPKYAPFLYKMLKSGNSNSCRDIVTEYLKKNINTKNKVNNVRWIFNDLSW